MNKTYYVLWGLAILFTFLAWMKSPAAAWEGANSAGRLFLSVLPGMLAGFLLGGMIQVLIPRDLVAIWIGEDSGFRGLLIATLAGAVTPGGPFVQFPLVASLWKSGAGVAPIITYVSSWLLLGMQRILVYEAPILGWRLASMRILISLAAPMAVGTIAGLLYQRLFRF